VKLSTADVDGWADSPHGGELIEPADSMLIDACRELRALRALHASLVRMRAEIDAGGGLGIMRARVLGSLDAVLAHANYEEKD
jgi:hypothetical protein